MRTPSHAAYRTEELPGGRAPSGRHRVYRVDRPGGIRRRKPAAPVDVLGTVTVFRGVSGRKPPSTRIQKWKSRIHAGLAGTGVSPRRHVRRRRNQLRGLLRGRRPGRAVPAARRRLGDGGGTARDRRLRPARLSARGDAGPAVRLPGARPVRAGARAALQLGEAAPRPVREGDQRGRSSGARRCTATRSASRTAQRPGLRAAHDELGRGQPVLRLGRRPPPAHRLPPHGDLRGPCEGPDDAPPGPARGAPRHLRGARPPGDHRPPDGAGGDRAGADAGAPVRQRPPAGRRGPDQLLGLQHHRLLRPAQRVRLLGRPRPAGAGVQAGGAGAARGRASR